MRDLISIVVPVYNVEKYLIECIESIRIQSYKNIEIILVDDGSTDNSSNICDKFVKKDSRIHVIHKSNGGLSDARNVGLQISKGKYIAFVDSDDFVDSQMIQKLYELIKENDADISMCNFEYFYMDGLEHNIVESPIKNEILTKEDAITKLFESKNWFYVVAWNKLYKKEIWKEITYPKGYIHEDEAVIHRLLDRCQRIVTSEDKLYFYRQVPGSIMNSEFNVKRLDKYFALADRIFYLDSKISTEEFKILLYQYWYNYLNDFYRVYEKFPRSKYIKRAKKSLIKVIGKFVKYRFFTFKDTISILIFLISPNIYNKMFYCKYKEE